MIRGKRSRSSGDIRARERQVRVTPIPWSCTSSSLASLTSPRPLIYILREQQGSKTIAHDFDRPAILDRPRCLPPRFCRSLGHSGGARSSGLSFFLLLRLPLTLPPISPLGSLTMLAQAAIAVSLATTALAQNSGCECFRSTFENRSRTKPTWAAADLRSAH